MSRPVLLDLFSGAGGAARGYQQAGFYVVGVDNRPQPHYCGDEFHQADALTFPLDGFDAIHASPPCQHWTAYGRRPGHVGTAPQLIEPVRERLQRSGLPYVIENVANAPLRAPTRLCGSSFGLDVRRHRYFESNVPMLAPPCDHSWQTPRFPQATNRVIPLDVQQRAMGIDWMTRDELSQALPPAYTEWIGAQLLEAMNAAA